MAVARQIVGIGRAHRAENELVAHGAAVDEQILAERVGAGQRGRGGKTLDHDAVALGAYFDGATAKIRSQDIAEPGQPAAGAGQRGGPGDRRAFLAGERKGDVGPRHREATHHLADRFGFGAVGLEKLQPRRGSIEEIADLDACALAKRRRYDRGFDPALDRQRPGMRLAGMARGDAELGHRADRGQRLAAEPERADMQQILIVELGGGVAIDCEREIAMAHAAAVVGDADPPSSAAIGEDIDPAGPGVDGVLHQFLDHARRTLDHFAGGDAVDDLFGKLADGHSDSRRLGEAEASI